MKINARWCQSNKWMKGETAETEKAEMLKLY